MYEKKILLGYPIVISMILMLFISCSATKVSAVEKKDIEKNKILTEVESTDDTKYIFPFEDEE